MTTKIPALRAFSAAFFIDHFLLHPNRGNLQPNRLIYNLLYELRPPEDVHDIDLLGNIEQRCIGFLAKSAFDVRIDRNDVVAIRLHVRRNPVAWAQRTVRESNDRNGFGALQQIGNTIGLS